jgi:SAM-dependent methyltransferase
MLFEERARAESFGAVAELYDRARPTYPAALVHSLMAKHPRRVLDVACGTGIAGALLAAQGCEVLGVELDERMARLARARGLQVEVAPFERWEGRGRSFDLAICAQAWHWIEPRAGTAKIAASLAAQGRIALFWNFGDPPAEVAERLAPIYARLEPDLENYSVLLGHYHGRTEQAVADLTASEQFGAVEVRSFDWSRTYETQAWLEFLQTHSDHHTLPAARRERLLSAVGGALDALGGSFQMGYQTMLVSARRE